MAGKENAKYFKCDTCDYSATTRGNLKTHTNLVHLKVKNYKCTQCSYKCGTNGNLKTHTQIVHLKRRDFACDRCDKAFGERGKLQIHIKSIHEKIKRFWCDQTLSFFEIFRTNFSKKLEKNYLFFLIGVSIIGFLVAFLKQPALPGEASQK
jgi:hypothetical protein